ncbi:MAG TPA: glycosyltransferase family 39 protein, partial [Usitatibacter sp.]
MNAGTRLNAALPILGAIALAACLIIPRARYPLSFDALHSYLPMARSLLDQGWAFMQRPESLATAPIGYLWPALFGADATITRWANMALFAATIALAYHAVRVAHSWQAGALAAFLIAISPTLRPFVADVLTEPPFFFLIAVWIVAVARTARGSGAAWIVAGGIALALATLTRPAIMYFAPVMVVVFLAMKERRLAAMHAIALAGAALWILRNAITFGFPAVATGAGAALFLGVNPLVNG